MAGDIPRNKTALHLCILIHGLRGDPNHLQAISTTLQAVHPADSLHVLVSENNRGNLSFDGIDVGAERVFLEVQERLATIHSRGSSVSKISIIGHSLGGLVARYLIGVLEVSGVFDTIEPVNFTTFATPHLGARQPSAHWYGRFWNFIGARTLCRSGRQLFLIDNFRATGRPLLAFLADSRSIFTTGLQRFKRRTLYYNISNDYIAAYYTTGLSQDTRFDALDTAVANYVPGYETVVLNPHEPLVSRSCESVPITAERLVARSLHTARRSIQLATFMLLLPVGIAMYMFVSVSQSLCSKRRLSQHRERPVGIGVNAFRLSPLPRDKTCPLRSSLDGDSGGSARKLPSDLATMLKSLDSLDWHKYPVWIRDDPESHAAIIARGSTTSAHSDGQIVLRHWVEQEFFP